MSLGNVRERIEKILRSLNQPERLLRLILFISLLVVTYFSFASLWYGNVLLASLLVAGWCLPKLLHRSEFWWIVALSLLLLHSYHWHFNDNHKWLFMLWATTIAIALLYRTPERVLAVLRSNGVWLLILVMLFSVVQKTLDTTYLNSSFFSYTVVTDTRFAPISSWLSGLDQAVFSENYERVHDLLLDPSARTAALETHPTVLWFGFLTTWWVWLIELTIGICFLLTRRTAHVIGHILHLQFLFITYAVAPVYGFGLLLAVIGLLLTHRRQPALFYGYLIAVGYLLTLALYLELTQNVLWY